MSITLDPENANSQSSTAATRHRPCSHRITRLVILIVLSLNFASVLAAHGNNGAKLYGGVIFVFAIAFFMMSLGRGVGGVSVFDWLCFLIAIAGIIG